MSYKTDLQDNNTDLQNILNKVNTLPEGTKLPVLSNPARAENIDKGFEAIDALGALIAGTSNKKEVVTGTSATIYNKYSLTFPNAIGKENIIVYYKTATGKMIQGSALQLYAFVIGGNVFYSYINGNVIYNYDSGTTWDKETGTITVPSKNSWSFGGPIGMAYSYIAW